MRVVNPATGAFVREVAEHTDDEVAARLDSAAAAFGRWRTVPLSDRATLMRNAARILRDDAHSHARLMTEEMGKPIAEARAEAEKSAWVCEYMAENAEAFLAPGHIESDASESYVRFEPLGAVLAVMPWNFPFWQVFRFAAPAIMAGNVGVLKHAGNVPGCAMRIEEIFREAGMSEGVFTSLLVSSERIEAVIRDPRVAAVTLTGSEVAGSSVAAIAGSEIKTTVLELGGSDPFIVLEDADLEAAVTAAVSARTINAGQSCIAAKRFIVVAPLYDRFVAQMARGMNALRVDDPTADGSEVGPLAREDLIDTLHDQVQRSLRQGARLVTGGSRIARPGWYYEPTLVADCKPGIAVFDEETFGPVAAVAQARDTDDGITLANASTFGLGASLWTSASRAKELVPRLEAGHVAVNGIVKSDPRLPFGGVKRSGYGRELSRHGMLEFVNVKTVWIA